MRVSLHNEMVTGMRAWFDAVEAGTAKGAEDVAGNLAKLVIVEERPTRDSATRLLGPLTVSTASPVVGTVLITPVRKAKT